MSLRELVDPECGGANPLMRLGSHLVHDAAHKDDGIAGRAPHLVGSAGPAHFGSQPLDETHLVNEFLGQMVAPPPQTFRMDALLQEMREIDARNYPSAVVRAPPVADEINKGISWANEYHQGNVQPTHDDVNIMAGGEEIWQNEHVRFHEQQLPPAANGTALTRDFFDAPSTSDTAFHPQIPPPITADLLNSRYAITQPVATTSSPLNDGKWTDEFSAIEKQVHGETEWLKDFEEHKANEEQNNDAFNKQFWNRLQDEWKKLSDRVEDQPPWLSEFNEYYDPYKEYQFDEDNPMLNVENAFEKGKAFLAHGDVPSAVLCFEAAVRQDVENAEIWELLGTSQAENEKDPNAIAALKKSLELKPNNRTVLMALAISYTNESLQNQALHMLIDWLRCNERYQHIVPQNFHNDIDEAIASSLIQEPDLKAVQDLYLKAVQQSPEAIDWEVQEALGVLFNLSSEYEKAADCFRAALQVKADSAKIWNRLGASLANGNLSVEAVDAYQHALQIEPGYIRARYNVGIICINLKAYNEAIEHFLIALNHQATSMARSGLESVNSNNQMSDTIWSTLRMALSLMGRTDLAPTIDSRDLKTLNDIFKTSED